MAEAKGLTVDALIREALDRILAERQPVPPKNPCKQRRISSLSECAACRRMSWPVCRATAQASMTTIFTAGSIPTRASGL